MLRKVGREGKKAGERAGEGMEGGGKETAWEGQGEEDMG